MPIRLLAALVAGVALALSFAPWHDWPLMPVALAAFFLSLRGVRVRGGALIGFVFGAGFWAVHVAWLHVIGVDAVAGLVLYLSVYSALLGAVLVPLMRLRWWPLWAATAWLAVETMRGGWPFGGFPWGRLAFATVDTPAAPGLAWVGTNGVGFLLALVGATLAHLVLTLVSRDVGQRSVRGALGASSAVVVAAGVVALGAVLPYTPGRPVDTARVALVQGNVPGSGDDLLAHHREVTSNHVRATEELGERIASGAEPRPDFVLWPENSTAVDPFTDPSTHAGIESASEAVDVPILLGAMVDATDPEHVLNQGIVWDPETGAGDRYTKRHPVPFGEYIPYRSRIDGTFDVDRLALIPSDMVGGTRTDPLRVGGIAVADAICFDIAFDDGLVAQLEGGAELVTVQTSNAMFIHTYQIGQQWDISRLRAIESGRSVVVAATNGQSGIVAPDGTVVADVEPRTTAVRAADVALYDGITPGVRLGPWAGRVSLFVTLAGILLASVVTRRRRDAEETRVHAGAEPVPEQPDVIEEVT